MSSHVTTPKWNIIFLIYADLSKNATQDPDTSIDLVPIKVQLDTLRKEILDFDLCDYYNIAIITNLRDLSVSDINGNSYFYGLDRATGAAQNSLVLKYEFKREGSLLQKGALLENAFQEVEKSFKAKHTLLITWDHGSGFGLLKQLEQVGNKNVMVDMLTNDELAKAIKAGISTGKVDVVVMFNCFMHNLHTLYALHEVTDYFVGPESIIAFPGYDYGAMLSAIYKARGEIGGAEIARTAVTTIRAKFINFDRLAKADELIIFGSSMERIKDLFCLIITLSTTLQGFIREDHSMAAYIRNCRRSCYEMTYPLKYEMVDLINWLRRLIEYCGNPQIFAELRDRIEVYINSHVRMASYLGDHPYSERYRQADKRYPPTGYSIYVPSSKAYYSPITENYRNYIAVGAPYSSSFIDGVQWRDFLDLLFGTIGFSKFFFQKGRAVPFDSNRYRHFDM